MHALDGSSLAIDPVQVFGLIGPNGAGNTTLVNVITGLAPGASGSVRIGGDELTGKPAHQVSAAGVAHLPGSTLHQELSAIDNVVAGMHRRRTQDIGRELLAPIGRARRAREARRTQALRLLEPVGLPRMVADRPADTLAYGQQRRLEIARALALDPRLLILDEPTAGMNPFEKREIGHLLAQLSRAGLTILLIEHDMPLVVSLCARIAVLDFGRKIAEGEPGTIARDHSVLDAYLGSETGNRQAGDGNTTRVATRSRTTTAPIDARARSARAPTSRPSGLHVATCTSITVPCTQSGARP